MADPFSMVVAIVAIGCGAGVIGKALEVVAMKKRDTSAQLKGELEAMRQEMAALKTWASDLVLSFDSTLHQQDARLQSLERRPLAEGGKAPRVGAGESETRPTVETVEIRPRA
jgi:hypothetical protein